MLTPSFHISQTHELVILTIHAPYTQLNDVEVNALGCEFWFYSSPYFLRLTFPHPVVDDDEPPASFDAQKGEFEIRLSKKEVGQHFPDLDLLATLLAPRKQPNIKPNIEVIAEGQDEEEMEEEDDDEWLIDQELCLPEPESLLNVPRYGFGNRSQGIFRKIKSEFKEIIDLPDPDDTSTSERETLRKADEDHKFSCDHYLADFMEPEVVAEYLSFSPYWLNQPSNNKVKFTDNERESLKKLGNKEFLLSKEDKLCAGLSLVDIMFAYAYNHRTTLGENSVESAWTINKLSPTLSWFAVHTSIRQVVISCFRRLLTYSHFRHWDLAQLVLKDTLAILKLGRRQVLKCLVEIQSLFSQSEPRYLLNQLYISDYCIWVQKLSDRKLDKLSGMLEQVSISKCDMGFELEELEHAALLVQQEEEEEEEENTLVKEIQQIKLNDCSSSCSSSDYDSSSSEISSSSLDSDDDSSPES